MSESTIIRGSSEDRTAYRYARDSQGYKGSWRDWLAMPLADRQEYEEGAAHGDTPRRAVPATNGGAE